MSFFSRSVAAFVATLAISAAATAQSFNLDCLNVYGNPTGAYGAAASQPGYWNNIDGFGGALPVALTDVGGTLTTVTMDASAGFNFSFNNAATSGDDQALMDDLQCTAGTTVWTINGLAAGDYKVYAYAWAPDNPTGFLTGVAVTGGSAGTQSCGGAAWSGAHVAGITYVTDQVNGVLAGGSLTITFSVVSGFGSVNGMQIEKLPAGPPPTVYCTSGTSTNGCSPAISATNNPSVSFAAPCQVNIANVEGQKNGIIFYGLASNPAGSLWCPLGSSYLCVKAPTTRTGNQGSGGTVGACDGTMFLDWDAFQIAHPGALGQPWLPGAQAHLQGWYRDPPACKTTQLTEALTLTYTP